MDVYLVGGAVRDELLGVPVGDRDWVVVGASAAALRQQGYRQVGRDFPVFLHPDTGDEYALARTERKRGSGHRGFEVYAGEEVTLAEDLVRRDLTINAMARTADGTLVDPYHGRADLEAGVLRHVSPAFAEDPLRVFRVARFAARLPDFQVAAETLDLMRVISERGELADLSAERVWAECVKALGAPAPVQFFRVLEAAGCLTPWFAELTDRGVDVPVQLSDSRERYASVAGALEAPEARALSQRLKCPKDYARLAQLVATHRQTLRRWSDAAPEQLHAALLAARSFKPDSELAVVARVVGALDQADLNGLMELVAELRLAVTPADLAAEGFAGAALGEALTTARITFIADALG